MFASGGGFMTGVVVDRPMLVRHHCRCACGIADTSNARWFLHAGQPWPAAFLQLPVCMGLGMRLQLCART